SFEDDDDEEEEASKEDEDEEEDHLALADSVALHAINPVPSADDTKAFETNESVATPPSPPQTIVPVSVTRHHRARISVRPHTSLSPSTKVLIVEYASAPIPPSPHHLHYHHYHPHSLGSHPHLNILALPMMRHH
nr:hypothetical protein [Tanacetum cinerariifolium]